MAVNLLLGVFTFSKPENILPISASVLVTISLWVRNPTLTKILSVPISPAFLLYNIFIVSYIGIIRRYNYMLLHAEEVV